MQARNQTYPKGGSYSSPVPLSSSLPFHALPSHFLPSPSLTSLPFRSRPL